MSRREVEAPLECHTERSRSGVPQAGWYELICNDHFKITVTATQEAATLKLHAATKTQKHN